MSKTREHSQPNPGPASHPAATPARAASGHHRSRPAPTFSKTRRPFGEPVALPKEHPAFVAPPDTNRQELLLPLDVVLPGAADRLRAAGRLVFHAVGDTGGVNGTETQEAIAAAMERQCQAAADAERPAFFYHLGDVVYYNGQSFLYRTQFYEPYQYYPVPIFAIPGNHDGEVHVRPGDIPDPEPTLTGFMENFCADQPRPARHGFPYRPAMTQPYVYWTLDTPLATLIGLYSNVDGLLDGRGANEQERWLEKQLAAAPADRCLIVAVHHPPYSLDGVHGGTPDVLDALDRAATASGRIPDAVFSGHVHSYQRFTRAQKGRTVPYLVAGAGGYVNKKTALHKLQRDPDGKDIRTPFTTRETGVTLESYNQTDSGFLRVTVTDHTLRCEYFTVPFDGDPPADPYDVFTLDWREHRYV